MDNERRYRQTAPLLRNGSAATTSRALPLEQGRGAGTAVPNYV
jgi:hypothetical protein